MVNTKKKKNSKMAQPPTNCNQLQNCRRKRWPKKEKYNKKNFISPRERVSDGSTGGGWKNRNWQGPRKVERREVKSEGKLQPAAARTRTSNKRLEKPDADGVRSQKRCLSHPLVAPIWPPLPPPPRPISPRTTLTAFLLPLEFFFVCVLFFAPSPS